MPSGNFDSKDLPWQENYTMRLSGTLSFLRKRPEFLGSLKKQRATCTLLYIV
jgi:hypothetical protein